MTSQRNTSASQNDDRRRRWWIRTHTHIAVKSYLISLPALSTMGEYWNVGKFPPFINFPINAEMDQSVNWLRTPSSRASMEVRCLEVTLPRPHGEYQKGIDSIRDPEKGQCSGRGWSGLLSDLISMMPIVTC